MKALYRKAKYYLIRLFRLKHGAKQIALGLVVGFFPCWYPTFGVGPVLSIVLTKLVKGNIVASIISAAIGSIVWLPLFILNYYTGYWIHEIVAHRKNTDPLVEDIEYTVPLMQINKLQDYGLDFLYGSIINSLLFSVIGYFILYFIFLKFRQVILNKLTE